MTKNYNISRISIALAALAGAATPYAHADGDEGLKPYSIGVFQGFSWDSNLFRAPSDGRVESDRISSTGVRAGLDLPIGRQRLTANAAGNYNAYQRNDQLNNTDYSLNGRLDWETIERISGQVDASQTRSLYRDVINGVVSTDRSQLRMSQVGFQARVGLVTLWSFEGGVAASSNDYSTDALRGLNMRQTSANAGVRWRPSDVLTARLGIRHTEGRYPHTEPENDHFRRDDIDLNGTLVLTGASKFNARLSSTDERHNTRQQRDLTGATGAFQWLWTPTGKLTFDSNLSHDSSVGQTNFDSSLVGADSGDARTSDTASIQGTWATTAKIQVVSKIGYVRRKLDSAFVSGGGPAVTATDRTTVFTIGARWQPTQSLEFACNVGREKRTADGSTLLTLPYTADTAGCSAQFSLR